MVLNRVREALDRTERYETSIDDEVSGELSVREDGSLLGAGSASLRFSVEREHGTDTYSLHTGGYGPSLYRSIRATVPEDEFGDGGENAISRLNVDPDSVFEYGFMEEFPVRDNPVSVNSVRVDDDGDAVDVSVRLQYLNSAGGTGYSTSRALRTMEDETGIDVRQYLDDELDQDAF